MKGFLEGVNERQGRKTRFPGQTQAADDRGSLSLSDTNDEEGGRCVSANCT